MTGVTWGRLFVVLLGALIFQVAVLDEIVIGGAHPDVMVLVAAGAGLVAGSSRGAMVGFLVGCFADLVVDTPYGLSALTFVLLAFACGGLRFISAERRTGTTEMAACIAAGAFGTLLFAMLGALIDQRGMFDRSSLLAILVVTLGALIMSPAVLWVMRWVFSGTAGKRSNIAIPSGGSAAG